MRQLLFIFIALYSVGTFAQTKTRNAPELVVTKGHKRIITSIDFHPSGKYYITASEDQTLKIWDWALKQEFRTLYGHKKRPLSVVYSPDGQHIASIDLNEIILWRHPSGKLIKRFACRSNRGLLFSPDSKYLYVNAITKNTGSSGNLVKIETSTGIVVKVFDAVLTDRSRLHPNGQILFNEYKSYNTNTGEELPYFEDATEELDRHTRVTAISQTHFASCKDENKLLRVWDLNNLKAPILRIKVPIKGDPEKMKFTHDGKKIIVADEHYKLLVYSIPKGKLLQTITHKDYGLSNQARYKKLIKGGTSAETGPFKDFAISPDDRLIATNARIVGYGNSKDFLGFEELLGVRFFQIKDGKSLGVFGRMVQKIARISVTGNEKRMVSIHDGANPGVRVWNLRKGQVNAFLPKGTGETYCNNKRLVVQYSKKKSLKIYKIPSLKKVFELKTNPVLKHIYLSKSQKLLTFQESIIQNGKYKNLLKVWNISKAKKPRLIRTINAYILGKGTLFLRESRISPNDKYLLTMADSSTNNGVGERILQLRCIELATGRPTMVFGLNTTDDKMLDFVPNTTHILIARKVKKDDEVRTQLLEIDYTTGKIISQANTKYQEIYAGKFDPDGQNLVTGSGGDEFDSRNIYYDVTIWDWPGKKINCVLKGHTFNVKHVWFGAKGKRVYSADQNSIVKIWDIQKCKISSTLLGLNNANYIIINPENYYKTSKAGINNLGFRYKGQLRELGQFDLRYNRPDLVIKSLGGPKLLQRIYNKAWKKRLQRAGMTEAMIAGDLHLPEISIVNRFDLPSVTNLAKVSLKIQAKDNEVPLKNIQAYVNGVPLYGKQGIPANKKNSFNQSLSIRLNSGINKITVKALNTKGLESAKESVNIHYKATKRKPNLYVLAVGVSKYQTEERNLKFAQKDATDLSNLLTQQASKNYNKVIVKRILNEQATKEEILKASKVFRKTQPDDQIIIYMSCHGLLDDQLNYYLATTDVDFNNPAKNGLPYEKIEQMLEGVPARNRLIMIDACHSGELDKSAVKKTATVAMDKVKVSFKGSTYTITPKAGLKNSFDYMKALFNDVSNSTGATIISAAAGYEFALESQEWNNGVFTYSVLEGCKSGKADLNKDGNITLSELKQYVIDRVTTLTKGQQVPTTRRENQNLDVVIFKK